MLTILRPGESNGRTDIDGRGSEGAEESMPNGSPTPEAAWQLKRTGSQPLSQPSELLNVSVARL
jgi:hypothetical protein